MTKENKVILFPLKNKIFEPEEPLTLEQRILELVLFELSCRGYDVSHIAQYQYKDLALLVETVDSIISRYKLESHFLHVLADNLYYVDEHGSLGVNKNLTYTIKETNDTT